MFLKFIENTTKTSTATFTNSIGVKHCLDNSWA